MSIILPLVAAAYLLIGLALAGIGMKVAERAGYRYQSRPWLLIVAMTIIWPAPALYVALTRKKRA